MAPLSYDRPHIRNRRHYIHGTRTPRIFHHPCSYLSRWQFWPWRSLHQILSHRLKQLWRIVEPFHEGIPRSTTNLHWDRYHQSHKWPRAGKRTQIRFSYLYAQLESWLEKLGVLSMYYSILELFITPGTNWRTYRGILDVIVVFTCSRRMDRTDLDNFDLSLEFDFPRYFGPRLRHHIDSVDLICRRY